MTDSLRDTEDAARGTGSSRDTGLVDPIIGRVVAGKYRVGRRLGAGGMGAVYRATHLETGGDVAIKVLHGTALGDEGAIRRFKLEAQNAAVLRHVNTIRVLDFGVDAGLFYLVMEYLEGRPLHDLLLAEGPLPWRRCVHILMQILKSLWEAHEHERRIIHRDIKPANVFVVDLPGEKDHIKVLDFGVSRALAGTGASTIGIIGTPFYMAPELWRGEPIDARTDLYALGCVAFQMLAGQPPFMPPPSATESLYPLLSMHLNEPPPPLATLSQGVPAPLAQWVESLLNKEPSRRPSSARDALEALQLAAGRASELVRADTAAEPLPAPPGPPAFPQVGAVGPQANVPRAGPPRRAAPSVWSWVVIGLVGLTLVIALALMLAQDGADAPKGPQMAAPAPTEVDPVLGTLQVRYRCRVSELDKVDANGTPLYTPAAMLARDRERVHAGIGDYDDQLDPVSSAAGSRDALAEVFEQFLTPGARIAILEGTPLVEVSVFERGLTIVVVGE